VSLFTSLFGWERRSGEGRRKVAREERKEALSFIVLATADAYCCSCSYFHGSGSAKIHLSTKLAAEYADSQTLPPSLQTLQGGGVGPKKPKIAAVPEGRAGLMIEDVRREGSAKEGG
jgi:hypothetical protein